jgi:type II secretory pathway component PulF
VLSLLIWLLGFVEGMAGKNPFSVFGLKGGTHAVLFFVGSLVFVFGVGFLFWVVRNVLQTGAAVDRILLRIPGIGGLLEALAIGRFSMALGLTTETGMPITSAVRLSMRGTGNGAFAEAADKVRKVVKEGHELGYALRETGLFPSDYLAIVETAEITGNIAEVMHLQARNYHDTAARRMKVMTWIAAGVVWLMVLAVMIFFIFSIAMQVFGVYNQAFKDLGID